MSQKKRIFIASSAEAHSVAEALQDQLRHEFDVRIWSQDVFTAAVSTFESFDEVVRNHTYGVFVFAPDDPMVTRGAEGFAPRLNVVFEMGYFAGVHGMRRAFIVEPKDSKVHKLSDLAGITTVQFDLKKFKEDAAPEIGPVVYAIKRAIAKDQISYPQSHLSRNNVLHPSITSIDSVSHLGEHDRYCVAAKLGAGQRIKVLIRGEFSNADANEMAFAWGFPMSPINAGWERVTPIVDGGQWLKAEGPVLAFMPVQFMHYLNGIRVEIYEDDRPDPSLTKRLSVTRLPA